MAKETGKTAWKKFPYADKAYDYSGAALKKAWSALHRGDCEPFPDEAWVKKAIDAHPRLDPKMPAAKAAEALQSAWRAPSARGFSRAPEKGGARGPPRLHVAHKGAHTLATPSVARLLSNTYTPPHRTYL